jgi:hypothetical protein
MLVCARGRMPDAMLMRARKWGCEIWVVRKVVAEGGSGVVVKEPGMRRMSNWGALVKEFWKDVSWVVRAD